jgi:hypothetical protein
MPGTKQVSPHPGKCPYHGRNLSVTACGVCEKVALDWLATGGTADSYYEQATVVEQAVALELSRS